MIYLKTPIYTTMYNANSMLTAGESLAHWSRKYPNSPSQESAACIHSPTLIAVHCCERSHTDQSMLTSTPTQSTMKHNTAHITAIHDTT